jgi:NADPH:quinone reductase-like Zn-dependent oxidoreductase
VTNDLVQSLMTAVELPAWGGADALTLVQRQIPSFGEREVLVQIEAAGVNPVDFKVRAGTYSAAFGEAFPIVLGRDFSGRVIDVGSRVSAWKAGDAVIGSLRMNPRLGCYASHIAVTDAVLARRPDGMSAEVAAALPIAGLTAWQALMEVSAVSPGQRVLVQAAAGGVGHLVVQLAHLLGAEVIATASARNHDFVTSLGADAVIDYTAGRFEDALTEPVDVVIDCVGGEVYQRSLHVVKPGGIVATMAARPDPELAESLGVRGALVFLRPDAVQLEGLATMVDDGRLRVHVERAYPLAQVADAHREQETGHVRGKLVLVP